jgi:hypothetical protein
MSHEKTSNRLRGVGPVLAAMSLVLLLAAPAHAAEAGATTVNAGVAYRPSLPQTSCTAMTYTIDTGVPQNITLAVGSHTFVGFFSMGATGSSSCESAQAGSGSITIFGTGYDPTVSNVLRCPALVGTYTRAEAAFEATASGDCTFPDGATVPLTVALSAAWRINNVGFDASVYGGAIAGALAFTG